MSWVASEDWKKQLNNALTGLPREKRDDREGERGRERERERERQKATIVHSKLHELLGFQGYTPAGHISEGLHSHSIIATLKALGALAGFQIPI